MLREELIIVANLPGFAGTLPVFFSISPVYHSPIEYPGPDCQLATFHKARYGPYCLLSQLATCHNRSSE